MKLKIHPPIIMVIGLVLMWCLDRIFSQFSVSFPGQAVIAAGLGMIGLVFGGFAVFGFAKAKTTVDPGHPEKSSALVTGSVYKITRNPMYLGLALILSGFAVKLGQPLNLLVIVGFVIFITEMQIKPEEAILREKFGEDYDAYCAKVRRWI